MEGGLQIGGAQATALQPWVPLFYLFNVGWLWGPGSRSVVQNRGCMRVWTPSGLERLVEWGLESRLGHLGVGAWGSRVVRELGAQGSRCGLQEACAGLHTQYRVVY